MNITTEQELQTAPYCATEDVALSRSILNFLQA